MRLLCTSILLLLATCIRPVAAVSAAALVVGIAPGCAANPAAQAAAIDSSIAGYERSVMRLHQQGLLSDDGLAQAHAFAVAEGVTGSPQERQRAMDIAQNKVADLAADKVADLAAVVQHVGGEPPGPWSEPGIFR
jgi:hypothetical protein